MYNNGKRVADIAKCYSMNEATITNEEIMHI